MDLKYITIAVFFDFSKAFPSVDHLYHHNLLINKVRFFNILNSVRKWFESYVDSRFQKKGDVRGNFSDWDRHECGVFQRTVLSSVIF